MLKRDERITVALTVVFVLTLGLARWADGIGAWLVWASSMVVLAGAALIALNRDSLPAE